MKKLFALMALLCIATALFGQENNRRSDDLYYSVDNYSGERARREKVKQARAESIVANQNPVYAAGTALKKSVNWQCAAIGSTVLGGASFALGTAKQENNLMIIGYCCFGFAMVSQAVSIVNINRAGKSLQIAAGKITYTF